MDSGHSEFIYKLPGKLSGFRPGSHHSITRGPGMNFAAHARLFDQPDPRRIDLRASMGNHQHEWLVRANHQRSNTSIMTIVDVAASMHFGTAKSKLLVIAEFIEALGFTAYRSGDAVGMLAYDQAFREDLYCPARLGRGVGINIAQILRDLDKHQGLAARIEALYDCLPYIPSACGLVFLISDFHWPIERLAAILDQFAGVFLVPIVVWDPAETEPPEHGGVLSVRDMNSGQRSSLWLRSSLRQQWRDNVQQRRQAIIQAFKAREIRPFFMQGNFEAEEMTRYFMENSV